MREEFEIYIKDTYSPEQYDLYSACFDIFDQYEIEDYENSFIDLLMEAGNKDTYQASLEFIILIKNTLLNVLHSQGVEINEEADIEIIKEIARCLLEIQHYEDKQSILDTLDADFHGEERLCELFRFVSSFSVDKFIVAIDGVNEAIFVKLREIYTEEINEVPEDTEVTFITNKLKVLKSFLQFDDAVGFKLIRKSASIGLSFDHYLFYLKKNLEDMEVEQAAKELMVLLVMSKDTHASPLEHYSIKSGDIFLDIDKISKVNVQLVKLFSQFEVLVKNILSNQQIGEHNA